MSADLVALVWSGSTAERGSRLVMLALAEGADTQGRARLSTRELTDRTRMTARHVRNCVVELEELGELRVSRGGRGRGDTSEYTLLLGEEGRSACSEEGSADAQEEVRNPEAASVSRKSATPSRKQEQPFKGETALCARAVGTPFGSTPSSSKPAGLPAAAGRGQEIPDEARELVDALTRAGMLVGWGLTAREWTQAAELAERWGPQALVDFTARRWDAARPPKSARYLLRMWSDLPPSAAGREDQGGTVVQLPRPAGTWQSYRNATPAAAYENGF